MLLERESIARAEHIAEREFGQAIRSENAWCAALRLQSCRYGK
jgi:hypothetical protein